jgi:hypothetical protein
MRIVLAGTQSCVLEMFLNWAAFMYTGISRVESSTMELCRLRLAARNHCVH